MEIQQRILTNSSPVQLEDETVEDPAEPLDDIDDNEHDQEFGPEEPPSLLDIVPDRVALPENPPPSDAEIMPPPPPRSLPPRVPSPQPSVTMEDVSTTLLPESPSVPPPPVEEPSVVPPTEDIPPTAPPPNPTPNAEEVDERDALLRQLDLLRLKFKQSIIPRDIENRLV